MSVANGKNIETLEYLEDVDLTNDILLGIDASEAVLENKLKKIRPQTIIADLEANKADLVDGKVPSNQLPSYVDDVLEYANYAALPGSGESGKIYVTSDTNLTYRWSGTGYVEISQSLALGETSSTAYRGDRGKTAYDHSQVTHDKNLVGLGNVDNTSDVNKPVSTAQQTALDLRVDKVTGKGLSTEDYTSTEKTKLAGIESGAQVNVVTSVAGKTGAVSLAKGDVGLGNVDNTSDVNKPVSTAQQTALNAKADLVGGLVPSNQLPSYVDDVLEYANYAALPGSGESGKIYVTSDTNLTYRWSGTGYVEISQSLALGETSSTAYRGDRGKTAYDHSQVTHDKNLVGLGNVTNDAQLKSADKGVANGVASLNASTLVVENPANATATPTASKIVIAGAGGKVDEWVTDASDTAKGKVELATVAETSAGSDATRAVTPDGLAGSLIFGVKVVEIQIVADVTEVDTTSGVGYFKVPQSMDGMNLIRAQGFVTTAGTTNATTIQVRNLTKYASNDALSTAISIASGATVGTPGTVNTAYDDIATDNNIKIYVTAQSTTKPKGLYVVLEYQLP